MFPIVTTFHKVNSRDRLREAVISSLVAGIVFAASLLNFLTAEHYPVLTLEVALVAAALACAAVAIGLLYAIAHTLLRALLEIMLLLFALDLNFDGWTVLIGTAAITIIVNRHLMKFLGIAASVVLLTELPVSTFFRSNGIVDSSAPMAAAGDTSLSPLIHIILDEHIGLEGLIDDNAARAMADELRSFYLGHGFHVSGGAYSEYLHTVNAIPALLNFGETQAWSQDTSKSGTPVRTNRYFDLLQERGYAINVFQTPYMDYCVHAAVVSCRTSPKSLLLAVESADLPLTGKAILLGREFARLSPLAIIVGGLAELNFGVKTNLRDSHLPSAASAIETLDVIASQLRKDSRGSAFFVHVLFPHYPYVFDRSCKMKPLSDWLFRRSTSAGRHLRHERQAAYYEQLSCLLTTLKPIFVSAGQNATIIIHGDHGSRITDVDPKAETIGKFSEIEMIAGFSTLYAVRAPSIPAGYDRRALPVGLLLKELIQSDFRSARPAVPATFLPSVILDNASWKPALRHPLPADWPPK